MTTRKNPAPAPAPATATATTAPETTAPETTAPETVMAFDEYVTLAVKAAGYENDRLETISDIVTGDESLFSQWKDDPALDLSMAIMMAAIESEEFSLAASGGSAAVHWPADIIKLAAKRVIHLGDKLPAISGMPKDVIGASAPLRLADLNQPVKAQISRPRPGGKLLFNLAWGSYGRIKVPAIADGQRLPLQVLLTVLNSVPIDLVKETKFLQTLQKHRGGTSILSVMADKIGRYVVVYNDFTIGALQELHAPE